VITGPVCVKVLQQLTAKRSGGVEGRIGLREKVVLAVIALLLLTGGIWRSGQFSAKSSDIIMAGYHEQAGPENGEPELITVHLVGAVNKPGIYHLPVGSRVYELIDLCGGFSEEADRELLNQARPLLDGEQIYIYTIGEAPASLSGNASAKININQASASELTALPGIGEVRAAQIVAYREKHGFFKDIREIMDVGGIGEKTFENISELITVY
jgi:competence protein ComEA